MRKSTVIFCAPEIAPLLAPLVGAKALSNEAFVEVATALGGTPAGWGRFRVREGKPQEPSWCWRWADRGSSTRIWAT